jgi:drug/metabolite transporter (DMT)-like permease
MSGRGRRRRGPELVGPVVLVLVGLAVVVAAWAGASGQDKLGPQLPYLNLAVAGAVVAAAGNVLYLVGYRGLIRDRLDDVQRGDRSAP